jgi:hypothetical protein
VLPWIEHFDRTIACHVVHVEILNAVTGESTMESVPAMIAGAAKKMA